MIFFIITLCWLCLYVLIRLYLCSVFFPAAVVFLFGWLENNRSCELWSSPLFLFFLLTKFSFGSVGLSFLSPSITDEGVLFLEKYRKGKIVGERIVQTKELCPWKSKRPTFSWDEILAMWPFASSFFSFLSSFTLQIRTTSQMFALILLWLIHW